MKRRNVIGPFCHFFLRRRRQRRRILDSVDRISDLPDSILAIILSFLPTIDAVSTALLSKRWKKVWMLVHNLDFYYVDTQGEFNESDDMIFVEFANRAMVNHYGCLNKFRLVWSHSCISYHAAIWISTAITKRVHELFIRPGTQNYECDCCPEPFEMPISVFSCDTLRVLELDGGIYVSESIVVRLPKLETIMLASVHFQSKKDFEKLIRGCPVLINLYIAMPYDMLDEFYQDGDFTYIISSTSLRRLEVDIQYLRMNPFYINLEVEAPSLEYLSLDGFIPIFPVNLSLSSLVEAKLDTDHLKEYNFSDVQMCNSVVKAVRVFDWAKALNLSAHTMWALSCAPMCLSIEFKRLVKLEVQTYTCACSSLRDFIECSNNLEVLTVYQRDTWSGRIEFDTPKWIAPVQVPRCFSNSLKKVKIERYRGLENEREMVRYMLKHGKALEDMEISFYSSRSELDNAKSEFVREICELSKKLSRCEVKFSGETSE